MTPRTNKPTAMLIDLAAILLPLVGYQEAARMLVRGGAPLQVATRTLTRRALRHIDVPGLELVGLDPAGTPGAIPPASWSVVHSQNWA